MVTIYLIYITTIAGTTYLGQIQEFLQIPLSPDILTHLYGDTYACIYNMIPSSIISLLHKEGDPRIRSNRVFIKSSKEFMNYTRIVLWICRVPQSLHKSFIKVNSSMETLWKRSGKKFAGLYFKECLRLIVQFVNHNPTSSKLGEIQVKSINGLPLIIPLELRRLIKSGDRVIISSLLTMFSIFRCIKWKTEWDPSSIFEPFSGEFNSLPMIQKILKDLGLRKVSLKITYVKSISSGPRGQFSLLQSGLDASTLLIRYPKIYFKLIRASLYLRGGTLFSVLLILISILNIPLYFLDTSSRFNEIRRLGYLEEGAGKIRTIAMLDWWTQCLFKDLHDHIFSLLRKCGNDCTFDQTGPLQSFISTNSLYPCASFDLSDATNRLPIQLQSDLIDQIIPGFGPLWKDILVSERFYSPIDDRYYSYSVGQPMGAYSSFALLALSHHYIVRYACHKVGKGVFPYVLLGDDICLSRSEEFFSQYKSIISGLGVKINLSKSIISNYGGVEFTKRLFLPYGEISPIGSRTILMASKF